MLLQHSTAQQSRAEQREMWVGRTQVEGGVGGKASEQVKAKSKLQIENERSEGSEGANRTIEI